jgi:hypothetical protein
MKMTSMNSSASLTKKFLACSSVIYVLGTQPLACEGWNKEDTKQVIKEVSSLLVFGVFVWKVIDAIKDVSQKQQECKLKKQENEIKQTEANTKHLEGERLFLQLKMQNDANQEKYKESNEERFVFFGQQAETYRNNDAELYDVFRNAQHATARRF